MSDPPAGSDSLRAWTRALARVAPFARGEGVPLPTLLPELAARFGTRPALLSDGEVLGYRDLAARANRYAHWALRQGIAPGDVVCLLLANCPDYVAIWLGITAVRGVVALLNTNLSGDALAHAIATVAPTHIIVGEDFADRFAASARPAARRPVLLDARRRRRRAAHRPGGRGAARGAAGGRRAVARRPALHIYTSGTTGLPKAARVSHRRVMEWSCWFAGMMDTQPDDRMYNCLPLYHSVGGIVAIGAMLVGGGSVLIRPNFSASRFWDEVVERDCTVFQYIGELCRYLLDDAAASARDRAPAAAGLRQRAARRCLGSLPAALPHPAHPRILCRHRGQSLALQLRPDGPARSGVSRPFWRIAFRWR